MTDQPKQVGGGRRSIGDFAPKLAELTDDILFEDVWNRTELSARDRSLVTVAALVTSGSTDQLDFSPRPRQGERPDREELIEAITHLAFYAGWPKAMSAIRRRPARVRQLTRSAGRRFWAHGSARHAAGGKGIG